MGLDALYGKILLTLKVTSLICPYSLSIKWFLWYGEEKRDDPVKESCSSLRYLVTGCDCHHAEDGGIN